MQKPAILTQSRFNPPDEVKSAAKYCAVRGIKGNIGDPLPIGLSGNAHDWINKNHLAFSRLVSFSLED